MAEEITKLPTEATPSLPASPKIIHKAPTFADDKLVLFMHPYSFHSLKVMLALYEKNITFETYALDLHSGEQFSPWFLSLNPKGEVPVLRDGPFVIPESTQIINYIADKYPGGEIRLAAEGLDLEAKKKFHFFERILKSVPVGALSLGSFMHDDLNLVSKPPFVGEVKKNCLSNNEKVYGILKESIQDSQTQNKAVLLCKLNLQDRRRELVASREQYNTVLEVVGQVLQIVEEELRANPKREWLLSDEFMLPDLYLGMLLQRLYQLGFEEYYWIGKRPHIEQYFQRFQHRPSYERLVPRSIDILKEIWEKTSSSYMLGAGFLGMAMFAALAHK